MATKSLTTEESKALADFCRALVETRFDGNARKAARAIGISQPSMSAILTGKGGGIRTVIQIARYTNTLIERVLGLPMLLPRDLRMYLERQIEDEALCAEVLQDPNAYTLSEIGQAIMMSNWDGASLSPRERLEHARAVLSAHAASVPLTSRSDVDPEFQQNQKPPPKRRR
jgi:hypothetical protein